MYLASTTNTLEAFMSEAIASVNPTYVISFNVHSATALTPDSTEGSLNGVTDVTILAAPGASAQRQVVCLNVYNGDTIPHIINIQKDVSGTEYLIFRAALLAGESLEWTRENSWRVIDATGRYKDAVQEVTLPYTADIFFMKAGSASDTTGYWYSLGKDTTGLEGPWAPGTPGVNGRTTDGTAAADAGCIPIPNPSAGGNYITTAIVSATLVSLVMFYDVLWVNSGLVVTTTGAQAIVSGAMPARDANGSTSGEGLMIGLLFVAAATNAAVISNSTVTYTNSAGTASRTATLANLVGAQIPVTPTVGTIVWFMLAAGDKGVQSIQSISLGTSLVTGTISLLVARPVLVAPCAGANIIPPSPMGRDSGVRIYNNSCILYCVQPSNNATQTVGGKLTVIQR